MRFDKTDIEEFRKICLEVFGGDIPFDKARQEATKLFDFTRITADGLTLEIKDNSNFIIDK